MKLPGWARAILYLMLLGATVAFVVHRWESISGASPSAVDILLVLFLLALATSPLFEQVTFFGLGLRNKMDELRNDVKEQMTNLRNEIQVSNALRADISQVTNVSLPPQDEDLPDIRKRADEFIPEKGVPGIDERGEADISVPGDTAYLFSVRYRLEQEVRRIAEGIQWAPRMPTRQKVRMDWGIDPRNVGADGMLRLLVARGVLTEELVTLVREVLAVCSAAVHGRQPSRAQVEFVRDLAPRLVASLKGVNADDDGGDLAR